jgi:hypothetical protein
MQEKILASDIPRNFNKSMRAAAMILGRDLPPHIRRIAKSFNVLAKMMSRARLNQAGYRMVNKRGRNKLVKLQKGNK